MGRLIDAEELEECKWEHLDTTAWERGWNAAIDAILEAAPIVDAVPVVRCIECKHCSWADHYDALIAVDPLHYCPGEFDYFCDYFDVETEADGYCAWGERREDG